MARALFSLIAVVTFVFIATFVSAAQDRDKDAETWVQKASEKSNLRSDGTPAFELRGHIAVSGASNAMIDGTYSLIWNSPSQWREEVHLPSYDRVRIGGQGMYWQRRSPPFEPLRVWQLDKMFGNLSHLDLLPGDKLGKRHERKVDQEKLNCMDVINERGFHRVESCFDPTSSVLREVSDPSSGGQTLDGLTQMNFSDYQDWNGKSFPRNIRGLSGKTIAVEFHVDSLEAAPPSPPATFAHLPDDMEWIQCEKPDKISILEQTPPRYPLEAKAEGKRGTVAIYVVIEANGEISHEKVVAPTSPELDAAAFDAISHWKYKPPTCQGTPYSLENIILIAFTIGN